MTDTVTLRLTIPDPVPYLHYSLQDPKNVPVDIRVSTDAPLSFDVPVTLKAGKLTGPFVRREGKERRFVYIAIAGQAGQSDTPISRRAKIDVHDIPADLLKPGAMLEAVLPGRDKVGLPACATVRPLQPWRSVV